MIIYVYRTLELFNLTMRMSHIYGHPVSYALLKNIAHSFHVALANF